MEIRNPNKVGNSQALNCCNAFLSTSENSGVDTPLPLAGFVDTTEYDGEVGFQLLESNGSFPWGKMQGEGLCPICSNSHTGWKHSLFSLFIMNVSTLTSMQLSQTLPYPKRTRQRACQSLNGMFHAPCMVNSVDLVATVELKTNRHM